MSQASTHPSAAQANWRRLGWTEHFDRAIAAHEEAFAYARVVRVDRGRWIVVNPTGEREAQVPAVRTRARAGPVVGDWVALREDPPGTWRIVEVLDRHSWFTRQRAGHRSDKQVVVANVDRVFVLTGLDGDLNLRRLERYLALAQAGGCETTVVLSKADLIEDVEPLRERVHATLGEDLDVIALSVVGGRGLEGVEARMADGETAAILGSSGVGKSTLVNALLGEERFATQGVRKGDQKGRHTTSHRELVFRDDGSALIDTPGMRELQLWGTVEDVDEAFVDVFEAAQGCRFRDCRHLEEPGCAVREAVKSGGLEARRVESYRQLRDEVEAATQRQKRRRR